MKRGRKEGKRNQPPRGHFYVLGTDLGALACF